MKTPRHKIAAYLAEQSLKPNANAASMSKSIAAYLLETGRTGELSSLLRDIQQRRADHGVVEVTVSSAHTLSAEAKADVRAQIQELYPRAIQIIISEVIDPELIGGLRLELPHQQLDLRVRGKLNRFKQLTTVEN